MLLWFIHSDNVQFDEFNREADINAIFVLNQVYYIYKKNVFSIRNIIEEKEWSEDFFLAFEIVGSAVHSFFSSRHNGQWPPTSKDFLSQILSITFIFLS